MFWRLRKKHYFCHTFDLRGDPLGKGRKKLGNKFIEDIKKVRRRASKEVLVFRIFLREKIDSLEPGRDEGINN
jgi:hypothetical protein